MQKRALVTGACGFTGTHMVELLAENGWDVTGTDLSGNLHKEYYCENGELHPMMYEDFVRDLGIKFINADLTDKESLKPLFDCEPYDAIFHTASLYDYFAKWDVLYRINVEGTRNLAQLAAELSGRLPLMEYVVDPEVIGGLVLQIGDCRFDSSVRSRLRAARTQLLERSSRGLALSVTE